MVKAKIITNRLIWEAFIYKHKEVNFLQSYAWGEFHEKLGHTIFRYGFYKSNDLIGIMLVIIEHAKRATYATIPGGPIINWDQKSETDCFIDTIKQLAKQYNCVFIRVRPQIQKTQNNMSKMKKLGFILAPMHLHAQLTNQINLNQNINTLFSSMRKTTRHEIKKAQKLKITVSSTDNTSKINDFYKHHTNLAKIQNYVPFSYQYLKFQFETFVQYKCAKLYSAYLNKKLLSQAFIIFYNKQAIYHYGISTLEGRKYPGAYALQWQIIQDAKKLKYNIYNLWGVAEKADIQHRFYNLSVFKRGFGGEDFDYVPAHDFVMNPILYSLNFIFEIIRKKTRKL